MKFYAQLNENKICIGISQLSGEVIQDNMVEIQSFDNDKIWRKYENKAWSVEKLEPESTAPIIEFEQLKSQLAVTQQAVQDLVMGV